MGKFQQGKCEYIQLEMLHLLQHHDQHLIKTKAKRNPEYTKHLNAVYSTPIATKESESAYFFLANKVS